MYSPLPNWPPSLHIIRASARAADVCQLVASRYQANGAAVIGRRVAVQPASQLCAEESAPGGTQQLDCCLLLHHHRLFVPGQGNSGVTRVLRPNTTLIIIFKHHQPTI